jgi:receptor expression-enhancing protein 5/6
MRMIAPFLGRIPLWYEAKLLLVAWLVLPQFRGASFIYDKLVREQLRRHGVRLHDRHGHGHGADHEPHVLNLKV